MLYTKNLFKFCTQVSATKKYIRNTFGGKKTTIVLLHKNILVNCNIIGVSLNKPHTGQTTLLAVCVSVYFTLFPKCLWVLIDRTPLILFIKWSAFQFLEQLKFFNVRPEEQFSTNEHVTNKAKRIDKFDNRKADRFYKAMCSNNFYYFKWGKCYCWNDSCCCCTSRELYSFKVSEQWKCLAMTQMYA